MRWFRNLWSRTANTRRPVKRRRARLGYESLEERCLLAGTAAAIVFQTDLFGNPEIASISPDGTGLTRLTNNAANDVYPDATRDGSKIVFASLRDGNYEIYLMNGDGAGQKRLTNDPGLDYDPSISPDGSRIAFVSTRSGNYDIWVMNADGSGLKNMTAASSAIEFSSSWSADGAKLLFTSYRDGNEEIYVINADGTGQTRITNSPARDSNPVFSPDGTKIAFQSERDGNREIYLMSANGSGQTRLTNDASADQSPSFSPDGTQLAFSSSRAGNSEIYRMKSDGTGLLRLTTSTAYDTFPIWVGSATVPLPKPTLAVNDISVTEGNSGKSYALFTVTLSSPSNLPVTVSYATANGAAVAGSDYLAATGVLTFAPGTTKQTIAVAVNGDLLVEPNETFVLNLSAPTNATLADGQGQGTIMNDDLPPPPAAAPGVIYFESNRDGGYRHIFRMNADGSNVTQLTFGSYNDAIPEASEDGTKIVFASDRSHPGGNDLDIYLMNWDGTNIERISQMTGQEYDPSISPDKRYITFQGAGVGGPTDLFLYDRQTQTTKNLTNDALVEVNPAWGADGQTLIYTTNVGGSDEVFLMKFDAAMNVVKRSQLTFDSASRDFYPDINYDGNQIAWSRVIANDTDIYLADLVADALGNYSLANITNLTHAPTTAESIPYFSPEEGDWLSFVSNRDLANSAEIYTINIHNGVIKRLTSDTFRDLYPTWVEAPLVISISDASVVEGNPDAAGSLWTSLVFTVTLSRPVDEPFQVSFATADGSAVAGADYQAASGVLTFAPGVTTQTITVLIRRDLVVKPNRFLLIGLTKLDPEGEFGKSQAVGTILDDDV